MRLIKLSHRFKGSLPSILNEVTTMGLNFNTTNPRSFDPALRCVTFAFNGNKLIEYGYNKNKTHTFTKQYHEHLHNSIHAEADTIMKLIKKDNIKKVTDLVVMRGTTKLLNSHPCVICTGLIKMYFNNVRVWYFDNTKNVWKCELMGD